MVFSQLVSGDGSLFFTVPVRMVDVLHQPLVAGGGAEHAAHQMIPAVGMSKGMQGVVFIHPEGIGGNENRAGGTQGNVAASPAHHAGAHGSGGVVPRSGADPAGIGNPQRFCHLGSYRTHGLVAFIEPGHLVFPDTADRQHFR